MSQPSTIVLTHSATSLSKELIGSLPIHIMRRQITYLNGNREEPSGDLSEWYAQLERETVFPTSFPPAMGRYIQLFEQLLKSYQSVLLVHVSPSFSRSYQAAMDAARSYKGRVVIFNSGSVSLGAGLQVLTAARMVAQGAAMPEILAALEAQKLRTTALFVPASLRYLRNSTRLGGFSNAMATLLHILPVIQIKDDEISVRSQTNTRADSVNAMLKHLSEQYTQHPPTMIGIMHAAAPDVERVMALTGQFFPDVPVVVSDLGALVTLQVGPQTVGITAY